jgi:hypothetical protein
VAGCCECGDEPSGSCATALVSKLVSDGFSVSKPNTLALDVLPPRMAVCRYMQVNHMLELRLPFNKCCIWSVIQFSCR